VCYHKALKQEPFNTAVLVNIAQAHAREGDHAGVEEFCTRAIFVDAAGPQAVKAFFRRAASRRVVGRLAEAVEDLRDAAELDAANADVAAQLANDERALEEARVERDVAEKVSAIQAAKGGGGGAGGDEASDAARAAPTPTPTPAPPPPPAPASAPSPTPPPPAGVEDQGGQQQDGAAADVGQNDGKQNAGPAAQDADMAKAYEKIQAAMADKTGLTILTDVVDVLLGKDAAAGRKPGDGNAADLRRVRVEAALRALPELLEAPEARVHFRVSGALSVLCRHARDALPGGGNATVGDGDGAATPFTPEDTPLVLDALARASETLRNIDEVRSCGVLGRCVHAVAQYTSNGANGSERGAASLSLAIAAAELVEVCTTTSQAARECILGDGAGDKAGVEGSGALCSFLQMASSPNSRAAVAALGVVRNVALDRSSDASFLAADALFPEGENSVTRVASVLARPVSGGGTGASSTTAGVRETACAALANLFLAPSIRANFAKHAASVVPSLLRVLRRKEDTVAARAFALAALINATGTGKRSGVSKSLAAAVAAARASVCGNGGTAVLLSFVGSATVPKVVERALSLLSRCAAQPAALDLLRRSSALESLVRVAGRCMCVEGSGTKPSYPWLAAAEEATRLSIAEQTVRTIAVVLKEGAASAAGVLSEAYDGTLSALKSVGGIELLAGLLDDAGQRYKRKLAAAEDPQLRAYLDSSMGANISQCFVSISLACFAGPASNRAAWSDTLRALGVIDSLVTLLANAPDGPVRKNTAIVLARMAKDKSSLARIRELRGMEMLVQLNKRLL